MNGTHSPTALMHVPRPTFRCLMFKIDNSCCESESKTGLACPRLVVCSNLMRDNFRTMNGIQGAFRRKVSEVDARREAVGLRLAHVAEPSTRASNIVIPSHGGKPLLFFSADSHSHSPTDCSVAPKVAWPYTAARRFPGDCQTTPLPLHAVQPRLGD